MSLRLWLSFAMPRSNTGAADDHTLPNLTDRYGPSVAVKLASIERGCNLTRPALMK
jgi:hypothetical protein